MNINTKAFAVAATLGLGSVTGANAGLIDYTADFNGPSNVSNLGPVLNGSVTISTGSVNWTLTAIPLGANLISAKADLVPAVSPLVHKQDGIGVENGGTDSEVDYPLQKLTLTFSKAVKLTAAYFLDLYVGEQTESAIITTGGGDSIEIFADPAEINPVPAVTSGFRAANGLELIGKVFTFSVGTDNDVCITGACSDKPNYALAGVEVAAVPLPAGVLLLGTALAGLGFARRRKA